MELAEGEVGCKDVLSLGFDAVEEMRDVFKRLHRCFAFIFRLELARY